MRWLLKMLYQPNWVEQVWYQNHPLAVILEPLSWIYGWILWVRRFIYSLSPAKPFSVPIIVIGNLTAGGTGKTPLVMHLANALKDRYKVGIISRGYSANPPTTPYLVQQGDRASIVGDEAKMIAQKTSCPVVIDPQRRRAVELLLEKEGVDIILSDDGLQHLRLPRTVGVAVIDGDRLFGNRRLLPAGPLREPISTLKGVELKVVNGRNINAIDGVPSKLYQMDMEPHRWRHLTSKRYEEPDYFKGKPVHISTAIGNPLRFVRSLVDKLGFNELDICPHIFPDHYQWGISELRYKDLLPILMTEKDAVRCDFLMDDPEGEAIADRIWVLESELVLDIEFTDKILQYIEGNK